MSSLSFLLWFFDLFGSSLFSLEFLLEFKLDFLSLVFDFLRSHVESSLDLLSGNTRNTLDLISGSLLLLELALFGLELLVEFSPDNSPSDKLSLGLSSQEGEGFVGGSNEEVTVSGHNFGSVTRVDFHFRKIADFSSDDHLFIIFLIFRI